MSIMKNKLDDKVAEVKSCFIFQLSPEKLGLAARSRTAHGVFRDPAGMPVCCEIVSALCDQAYKVLGPKPGQGCEAYFKVAFRRFRVSATLGVTRRADLVEMSVTTWQTPGFFRRPPLSSDDVEEWVGLCSAIAMILRERINVDSLKWLTRAQAEAYWEKDGAELSPTLDTDPPNA